ncbi:ABC transporter substrate-binding protein [Brevibacillus laterosporus]|uniref:ABC transporter substrate-binding protein n=1 Tax=Brevibacillus laterosporus TaxID=1465 RepID=UPI0018CE23B3|nr:ABC transporter substrate-binding protein [Brevibacillus laterosporus]MBG9798435.1 peptide ABC transporter substrate-binding protein [Brevibacillus laterosporus]MCR8938957.1 ABC transporter substrate-binding protein [Brevibacillus laterosporus]MCZ0841597.1 ABC transporter substrate-binding protein [Brevibacillus laterosporus]MCZ0847006.1 ABC transporter substrate-binding protein [Brevibacillus laterosporus]MED1912961.1 ABC transporter substrate-binding protein [Brevibacillus laterosporus]
MGSRKLFQSAALVLLGSTLLLTGCGGAGNSATKESVQANKTALKTLTIGLKADPPSLDPMSSTSLYDRYVQNSVYDKLFDLDENGKIIPMLATSYEVSPDGRMYTLKIKEGVTFQDGTKFDAEAVKFNLDRYREEGSKRKGELKFVTDVKVVNPTTVQIMLQKPFSPLISIFTDRSGMMVSPEAVKKSGKDFLNNPVGSGPYKFVEHVKGDHVTLKKNEKYWNGEVKLDTINYKVFTNQTAAVQNLRSGMLDIVDELPVKEIPGLEKDEKFAVVAKANMGYQGLHLNVTKEPFTNKYLRQAVDRAIDREAVVKVLFDGYGLPARTPFSPGSLAHGESDTVKKPDDREIKALLEQGGKPEGFSFTLQIATSPANEQFGAVLQNMLKKYNIDMKLEKVEYGTMLENGDNGNFQALQLGWSGRLDPDQNIYDFHVTEAPNNKSRLSNPEVDQLLSDARSELDEQKRKALYDKAMAILQDEAPYIYIYHNYDKFGLSKKVKGFTYVPDGIIRTAKLDKE